MADILYIDDEPEAVLVAARGLKASRRFAAYQPPDFAGAPAVAANANLWVFDYFNDDEQRQRPDLAGVAQNGLSVFQQFRLMVGDARPPAVLVSNHLEQALGADLHPRRRHVMAEQLGVEWVAQKVEDGRSVVGELLALADATAKVREASQALAGAAPAEYAGAVAREVLAVPKSAPWLRRATADVAAWRPPSWQTDVPDQRPESLRLQFATRPELPSTRAMIAWLLRQALPHPSFVVNERHVAVRLGLDLGCLRDALAAKTELGRRLKRAAYTGALHGFLGRRWWSAGVDALAWTLPTAKAERTALLAKLVAPLPLRELQILDPVVVSDPDLVETDEIAAALKCVRAADDGFPAHAPPAWVKVEDARIDRVLAKKVRLEDQAALADPA